LITNQQDNVSTDLNGTRILAMKER